MYESLHNHTTTSDGTQSHLEVLATAEKYGFGVVAFTDHDTLPSKEDLEKLKAYTGPVKWFVGCEISSGLPKELGGGPTSMFHILGLFTDPFNEALLEHSRKALAARQERMERIVDNLQRIGFRIEVEDCLRASGGESVGRPHIVEALVQNEANVALLERMMEKMRAAAENDEAIRAKYENTLAQAKQKGVRAYPYGLFLSDDSFIRGVYVDYLYSIDMDKSVELIRGAGGVAILAHWGTIKHKINAAMLEKFLKEKRLDGVEVASGFSVDNFDATDELERIAQKTGVLRTIGIDAHRAEDFEHFANAEHIAKKTVGMTADLIAKINPDLSWSNIIRS